MRREAVRDTGDLGCPCEPKVDRPVPLKRLAAQSGHQRAIGQVLRERRLGADGLPPREDFQSAQGRALYDSIVKAPDRKSAERTIAELELDDVDIDSFLHLSGDHYYTYPALVRERAAAIRTGKLTVEGA